MDTLAELSKQYREAEQAYNEAKSAEDRARSVATDKLNALNKCQKAISQYMEQAMTKAPRGSDWWSEKHRRQELGV